MADPLVSPFLLALATAYATTWASNMYAARALSRLGMLVNECGRKEPDAAGDSATPVTLVVTHDGNGARLRNLLPAFLEQNHPEFEILLMSTRPLDREAETYLHLLSPAHPWLHSRVLPGRVQGVSIEALTLSIALRTAEHPWVMFCRLESRPAGPGWLAGMASQVRTGTCFVAGITLRRPQSFLNLWRLMMNLPAALRQGLYTLSEDNLLIHAPSFAANGGMARAAEVGNGTLAEAVNRLSRPTNTRLCLHPEAVVWQSTPPDPKQQLAEELFRHHNELRFTRRATHKARQRALVALTWLHTLLLVTLIATAWAQGNPWAAAIALALTLILDIRRTRRLAVTTRALNLKPYRLTTTWQLHLLAITRLRQLLAYDISDKNIYRNPTQTQHTWNQFPS